MLFAGNRRSSWLGSLTCGIPEGPSENRPRKAPGIGPRPGLQPCPAANPWEYPCRQDPSGMPRATRATSTSLPIPSGAKSHPPHPLLSNLGETAAPTAAPQLWASRLQPHPARQPDREPRPARTTQGTVPHRVVSLDSGCRQCGSVPRCSDSAALVVPQGRDETRSN